MPNRILKDSICTSPTIDELDESEETFFYRLIVHCDDFGLMDARESILRAKLYPLRTHLLSDDCIRHRLMRCAEVGLLEVYEVKGRPYLHLVTWENHQQLRAKRPKYPKPEEGQPITLIKEDLQSSDSNGNHLLANASFARARGIQSNPKEYESNTNPIYASTAIDATAPSGAHKTVTQKRSAQTDHSRFWEAFVDAIGTRPSARPELAKWGTGVKAIRDAGVPLEEIPSIVANYRARCPSLPCNPAAIAGHLSDYRGAPKPTTNGARKLAVQLPSNHQPANLPDTYVEPDVDIETPTKALLEYQALRESLKASRASGIVPGPPEERTVADDDTKKHHDELDRIAWEKRGVKVR